MQNRADGVPVNAVYGFTSMVWKLLQSEAIGHIAVVMDTSRATFRNDIYPDYKAHRPPPPEDLVPQFGLIREAIEAMGLCYVESPGYEADDLIASYARAGREAGIEIVIVGSDKDLMQLVGTGVRMFDPGKDRHIGPAEVEEKFGVGPDRVIDVQALAGDSVDNVPGAPGIGVKTAALLINEFGDLDNLLAHAEEIPQPKRRQSLIDNANVIRISRQLVTLNPQVPLPLEIKDLKRPETDIPRFKAFLETQGFRSLIKRITSDSASESGLPCDDLTSEHLTKADTTAVGTIAHDPTVGVQPDRSLYTLITTQADLLPWLERAQTLGYLAIDTETDSLRACDANLIGVSLAVAPGEACYIPVGHGQRDGLDLGAPIPEQISLEQLIASLKDPLCNSAILKIGHNLKYDMQVLARYGLDLQPWDDTLLMNYSVCGTGRDNSLDKIALDLFGHETIKFSDVCGKGKDRIPFSEVALEDARDYACEDADVTLCAWLTLKPKLARERRMRVYERIERPLISVVAKMEQTGVLVDTSLLKALGNDFALRSHALSEDIQQLCGERFNIASPKQLGDVLFDHMGLPGGKKSSKTRVWSTDVSVLKPLSYEYEVAEKILEWRHLTKLQNTYTNTLSDEVGMDGRIHTSFAQAATNTGRFSSTNPNLQNIPVRDEDGKAIRQAFIAAPGNVLISADYSQIELRLVAHMANVSALKHAFEDDLDIHSATAAQVFGTSLEEVTSDERRRAKAINFGILYGMGAFGLAKQLRISNSEAKSFIDGYLGRFPEIKTYMEKAREDFRSNGYVETLYGRKCVIHAGSNPAARAGAERAAINAPIQGTAADILKRAMTHIPLALHRERLSGRMVLTVHDEIVLEAPEAEAEATKDLVCNVMEGAGHAGDVHLDVTLKVDASIAKNWADAH